MRRGERSQASTEAEAARLPWLLWALVLLGALAGGVTAGERLLIERANRTVQLVADLPALEQLSDLTAQPLPELLGIWRQAGINTVAVTDLTAGEVVARAGGAIVDGETAHGVWPFLSLLYPELGSLHSSFVRPGHTYVVVPQGSGPEGLVADLRHRFGPRLLEWVLPGGGFVLEVAASPEAVRGGTVGLDPERVALARQAGLGIAPRWRNAPGATPERIAELVRSLTDAAGGEVVVGPAIFTGSEVLGHPYALEATAAGLQAGAIGLGLIEFAPQRGAGHLARLTGFQAVRVHSILPDEMATMGPAEAIVRYVRAVRERNIRVLYVRPFLRGGDPGELSRAYVTGLRRALVAAGFEVGQATPFPPWQGSLVSLLLVALGGSAAVVLMLREMLSPKVPAVWVALVILAVAVGATAALFLKGYTALARQAVALGSALVFPVLAVTVPLRRLPEQGPDGRRFAAAVLGWALAVAIALLGALHVIGALAHLRFMLALDQFAGVKLAHAAPLLVLASLAVQRCHPAGWPGALQAPVRWWQAAGLAVAGAAAVIYVARTGHGWLAAPELERYVRETLEQWLTVRPRTKEFLLGHPALLVALSLRGRLPPIATWSLLVLGAVGPISIINTFAHIHTPLSVSALRTAHGLLMGLAVGSAVLGGVLLWDRLAGRIRSGRGPGEPAGRAAPGGPSP